MNLKKLGFFLAILGSVHASYGADTEVPACKTFLLVGECAPPANTPGVVVSDKMRVALFGRCRSLKKQVEIGVPLATSYDGYTSNCCDHLTDDLASKLKVCGKT